jgi:hypothetical protein
MFEFTERSGHLLFQIVNKPTPLTNIDVVQVLPSPLSSYVVLCAPFHTTCMLLWCSRTPLLLGQGEMVLRNGIWTTDKTQHFVLQGLYFWNPGDLFLIANPLHSKQYIPPPKSPSHACPGILTHVQFVCPTFHRAPIIQDFMLTLKNESTVQDAIAQAANIPKLLAG